MTEDNSLVISHMDPTPTKAYSGNASMQLAVFVSPLRYMESFAILSFCGIPTPKNMHYEEGK
ncbi:hypothetical protein SOVF_077040 [Spinacia oleracea]|nr:hypothetical protein SOVF_077040 [Spinacia oleracea]